MDGKDPGLWSAFLAWLLEPSPTVQGFVMALLIAVLRLIYDRKAKWTRVLLEAVLCGLLAIAGFSIALLAITWLGLADKFQPLLVHLAVGVGGLIGFFGVEFVRGLAIKLLSIRLHTPAKGE